MKSKVNIYAGVIFFLNVSDIATADSKVINETYAGINIEAKIVRNPNGANFILTCDLPNTDSDWGGCFRCFLYDDVPKILGKFTYIIDAKSPAETIDGTYKMTNKQFIAKGSGLVQGKISYGFYIDCKKIDFKK